MDVSIVIVNYNTRHLLRDCISSIGRLTDGVSYEVIVVDNASTDDSLALIEFHNTNLKVIRCQENLGFGRGNNVGIKEATGNYCFLLNPDTVLMNNAIKIMFDFMERKENREAAACGAALFDSGGKRCVSYGKFATPGSILFYSIPLSILFRGNTGLVSNVQKEPFLVDYVTGADIFIRRDELCRVGLFDEQYFAYYEEADLAHRMAVYGYRSVIVPAAMIIHHEGKSFSNSIKRKQLMYESSLYYLNKYYSSSIVFKLYCLLSELKYRVYEHLLDAENAAVWEEMASLSKQYRNRMLIR